MGTITLEGYTEGASIIDQSGQSFKKIDKHYEKGNTFDQDTAAICELAEALRNCEPQADNKETEALLSELLLRISDVARITKIPQEQALADRIEDLIEKYE